MAFSPVDTPLQYQYKPLNLMAFAEPLAKMQEKYDLTKLAIEDSDVKATALQWAEDPQRAKALEEIYRAKRDEIAQNLAESKNYTQAGSQIKKLQRLWTEDPERLALESNYKLWEERNKFELERVAKNEISKDDYLEWANDEKQKFEARKGTAYTRDDLNPNGTYNPVTGKIGREKNLQEDLDKIKLDLAKAAPGEKRAGILQSLGLESLTGDAQFMQSVVDEKDPNKVAANVERYLKTLDRFKPWLAETANYKFNVLAQNPEKLQTQVGQIADNALRSIDNQIAQLEKSKKTGTPEYQSLLESRQALAAGKLDGYDPVLARNLFEHDFYNKKYSADEIAQVFAYKNIDRDYTFRDIPKEKDETGTGLFGKKSDEGSFDPTGALPVISSLTQQKVKSGQALYSSIKMFNDIAGGTARTFILGAPGSSNRKQLEASPGEQRERQMRLFNIAISAKDNKDFYTKVKAAGFNSGVTMDNATTLFNALKAPNAQQYVDKIFTGSQDVFNKYSDAKNQLEIIDENINSSPEFKKNIEIVANQKIDVTSSDVEKLAKRRNTTVDKLIKSGVVEVRTGGPIKYEQGVAVEGTDYVMSANNLARAYGFNNLADGIQKKMNIASINKELNGIVAAEKQKAINLGGQVMAHRYSGDKAVNEGLTEKFNSVSDLSSFMPATGKEWANTPGFDEDGRLAPGTSFDFGGAQSVKLVLNGNQVFYEIPIKYKDGSTTIKDKILVKPKVGTEPFQQELLSFIKNKSAKNRFDSAVSAQTYEMAQKALYDLTTKSTLTPIRANSYSVDEGEPPIVLETVPSGYAGTNLEIVKAYDKETGTNVYKVRANTPTGSKFLFAEDGKEFTSTDVNAAKVLISQQINGK